MQRNLVLECKFFLEITASQLCQLHRFQKNVCVLSFCESSVTFPLIYIFILEIFDLGLIDPQLTTHYIYIFFFVSHFNVMKDIMDIDRDTEAGTINMKTDLFLLWHCYCWHLGLSSWQPTPVFLSGESQGRGSLAGRRLWDQTQTTDTDTVYVGHRVGHNCSDLVAAAALRR